jgi:type II secretory pathway component PulL
LGLGVYQASGLTDVKMLTGQQYGERQELTLNVRYATAADVDTLRIDTAELEIRHEIITFFQRET